MAFGWHCCHREDSLKMLRVVVSSATELPNVEQFGKSDPYALISFQGKLAFVFWFGCSYENIVSLPSAHLWYCTKSSNFLCRRNEEENRSDQRWTQSRLERGTHSVILRNLKTDRTLSLHSFLSNHTFCVAFHILRFFFPQKFEWDLGGNPLSVDEVLLVQVKDWERIGRNR